MGEGFFKRHWSRWPKGPAGRGYLRLKEVPGWLALAISLLSLATGLLALALTFRSSVLVLIFFLASAFPALAGGFILFKHVFRLIALAREQFESRNEYEYRPRGADLLHVGQIVRDGRFAIGEAHPGARRISRRVDENPKTLSVYVREYATGKRSYCGYFLLYPLKKGVGRQILAGGIRSEAEFGAEVLCPTFDDASYLYVGMVFGTDRHARSYVKDRLRQELLSILGSGRVDHVFARPGTRAGLALMQAYGFLPIGDAKSVWSVRGDRLKALLRRTAELPTERAA